MSQRKWQTKDGWQVLTGWDRPLEYFFLNIDRTCRACTGTGEYASNGNECESCNSEGREYLFDNLDDKTGMTDRMGGMTIEQVRLVLTDKLTTYPVEIFSDLMQDKRNNVGNHIQVYDTQGEQKQQA